MERVKSFIIRGRVDPATLSLVFLFTMYVDLFLMSARSEKSDSDKK